MATTAASVPNALKTVVNNLDIITPAKERRKSFEVDRRPLRVINTDSLSPQATPNQTTTTKLSPTSPAAIHISFEEDNENISRGRRIGRSRDRRRGSSSLESSKSHSNMSDFVARSKGVVKDILPTKRKDKKKTDTTIQEALEILVEEHARQQRIMTSQRPAHLIRRNSSGSPVPVSNIGHIGCLTHLHLTNPDDPDENGDRGYFSVPSFAIDSDPNPADAPRAIGQKTHLQTTNPDDADEKSHRSYFYTPSFVTNPDPNPANAYHQVGHPIHHQNYQPGGNANTIYSHSEAENEVKDKDREATIRGKVTFETVSEFFQTSHVNSEDAATSNISKRKDSSGLSDANAGLEGTTPRMKALWSDDELKGAGRGKSEQDQGPLSTEGFVEAHARTLQERMRDIRTRDVALG